MRENIGLIDFGSNTFHLLIASLSKDEIKILYRERSYVFLAQGGISHIVPEAMERAFRAVEKFHKKCRDYNVRHIISVGTSALRTADNRLVFLNEIGEKYMIRPEIIDGNREAELIYKGMILACPSYQTDALMMDIGGGSTEFTLTRDGKVVYQTSLVMGLGELYSKFPLSDPATSGEINKTLEFMNETGADLLSALQKHHPTHLIGGSGTFDVLAYALTRSEFKKSDKTCTSTDPVQFEEYIDRIIASTLEQRIRNRDIPEKRIRLIVHACLSIRWILRFHRFERIVFSKYALKEGLLKEYYDQWKRQ